MATDEQHRWLQNLLHSHHVNESVIESALFGEHAYLSIAQFAIQTLAALVERKREEYDFVKLVFFGYLFQRAKQGRPDTHSASAPRDVDR